MKYKIGDRVKFKYLNRIGSGTIESFIKDDLFKGSVGVVLKDVNIASDIRIPIKLSLHIFVLKGRIK